MSDQHPTERLQLAELHGLGSWPLAVAALDAIGPQWVARLRRAILAEIRAITFRMEDDVYPPSLHDQLDHCMRALRHLGHEDTLGVPVAVPPAP